MTIKPQTASPRLVCASSAELEGVLTAYSGRVLGILAYAAVDPELSPNGVPFVWLAMPVIGSDVLYEVWVSARPVVTRSCAGLEFAKNDAFLFGCLALDETAPDKIETMAFSAYSSIFGALDRERYPVLLRAWNYFSGINETGLEMERYREFNIGRYEAFCESGRRITEGSVPAACALGTRKGRLVICFLAGRSTGIVIENPRQTNAYRYPDAFGPKSPTFSRGVLVGDALLVSGTASIVGSETLHVGDVMRQLDETLENLRIVVAQARSRGFAAENQAGLFINVYMRHAADYPAIQARLTAEFNSDAKISYLHADVCRGDLLVEIEAFWMPVQW